MSREDPPMRIRLPESLKSQIGELAKSNRRSMNAEIVARLEQSIAADRGLQTVLTVAERLDKLERQTQEIMRALSLVPDENTGSASFALLRNLKKNLQTE